MGIYNTKEWHRLRSKVRKRRVCANCGCVAIGKYNAHVDHIIPVREDPGRAYDITNLQLLCSQCHNSIKKSFEMRAQVGIGADGLPTSPEHPWNK